MPSNIPYITTKVPCEAALMDERHMRIEISDFVMRAFVPIQRKDSSHAVFFSFGNVSTFRKDGFLRSSMQRCCPSPLSGEQVSSSEDRSETGLMSGTQHFSAWCSTAAERKETMKLAGLRLRVI